MNEAKQIHLNNEVTIQGLMAELKSHITYELKDAMVEKPVSAEVAAIEYLGIHPNTIYKWIKSGDLPVKLIHRIAGTVYFFPSELRDYIKGK
jgi:predicted DNA-binding transcriptional regulator AlpA